MGSTRLLHGVIETHEEANRAEMFKTIKTLNGLEKEVGRLSKDGWEVKPAGTSKADLLRALIKAKKREPQPGKAILKVHPT